MLRGIYHIEPMGYDSYGRPGGFKCSRVGGGINAIGQSADHQKVGEISGKIGNKFFAEIYAVRSGAACAYNADHVLRIEIGRADLIVKYRGVVSLRQSKRIIFVENEMSCDVMLLHKFILLSRIEKSFVTLHFLKTE